MYVVCFMVVKWLTQSDMSHTDIAYERCEYIELKCEHDDRLEQYLTQRAEDLGADETPVVDLGISWRHQK
jgi:hypothetical protein